MRPAFTRPRLITGTRVIRIIYDHLAVMSYIQNNYERLVRQYYFLRPCNYLSAIP